MLPLVAGFSAAGEAAVAALHAVFPHTIGVLAAAFGLTAFGVGGAELYGNKAEDAANVGGSGQGLMDEKRLAEKAAREDAEMAADRAKARGARGGVCHSSSQRRQAAKKLAQPKGLLDPTNMTLSDVAAALTS